MPPHHAMHTPRTGKRLIQCAPLLLALAMAGCTLPPTPPSSPSTPRPPATTPAGLPSPPSSPGGGRESSIRTSPSSSRSSSDSNRSSSTGTAGTQPGAAGSQSGAPNDKSGPPASGNSTAHGTAAGNGTATGTAKPVTSAGTAKTAAEQDAEWDQAFDGTLIAFDERLGREQVELERRGAAGGGRGGASDGNGTGGDADTGGQGGAGAPGEVGFEPSADTRIGMIGGGIGNPQPGAPKFPAPEGTPDGANDDVVARQLREAAETEADPALRAKLWDEYRKYKTRKS